MLTTTDAGCSLRREGRSAPVGRIVPTRSAAPVHGPSLEGEENAVNRGETATEAP